MQIIYINGPSSSGKTTLAKALQEKLAKPFLHLSIDKMIGMMPLKMNCFDNFRETLGFWWKKEGVDSSKVTLKAGPFGKMVSSSFRKVAKSLAEEGHNLIIDDVSFHEELIEWKEALRPYDTLYVELTCSQEELLAREKERGDRMIGSAAEQAARMSGINGYDIRLDSGTFGPDELAQMIMEAMGSNNESHLIEKLLRPEKVEAELAIVIDVIRAFTTAAYAFNAGIEKIILVKDKEDAFKIKQDNPSFLLMGEEGGYPIEGFDFGNSPSQWIGMELKGKTLVQRTSSGTQGVVRSKGSKKLLIASFVIAEATKRLIEKIGPSKITFVITGSRDGDEDLALADYLEAKMLLGKIDPKPYLERVLNSIPAKEFAPRCTVFPEKDLELVTEIDRFAFAIEVQDENGFLTARPVY